RAGSAGARGDATAVCGGPSSAAGSEPLSRRHHQMPKASRIAITTRSVRGTRPRARAGPCVELRACSLRPGYLVTVQLTVCWERGHAVRAQYWPVTEVGHVPDR